MPICVYGVVAQLAERFLCKEEDGSSNLLSSTKNIKMKTIKMPDWEELPTNTIVKFGIDPTAGRLHLGHLVPLLLCRELQNKGHQIKIVLGTFTAQIGDPTGKEKTRPILPKEEVMSNAETIKVFVKKFLGDVEMLFNHQWLENWTTDKMMNLLGRFTWAQLSNRENFQKRLENNESISISELIMPLLQGLDSVQINAGIEVGGHDQLFNFKMTREVQRIFGQKPEICLMTEIINGTDGQKMSKSLNNCIFVDDNPIDVFGKTMRVSDNTMKEWWNIFIPHIIVPEDLPPIKKKEMLALEITSLLFGTNEAIIAGSHFNRTIRNKEVPGESEMQFIDSDNLIDCIIKARNISKSEARKLIQGNGISINGQKVNEDQSLQHDMLIKIGKRQFIKIKNNHMETINSGGTSLDA